MATSVLGVRPLSQGVRIARNDRTPVLGASIAAGLALLAIAIHGYHPYADDGGLYIAGVKRLLNPFLYPHYTSFVVQQTHLSAFAWIVATTIRVTHVKLQPVLFVLHFASVWATLFAAWLLAAECWPGTSARLGAISLLACSLSLPVAGTSLSIMDPYLTARSFSTPLGLLALASAAAVWRSEQRERAAWCALCFLALSLALLIHPVMAVYIVVAALLLFCIAAPPTELSAWAPRALCLGLVALSFAAHLSASPESSPQVLAAMTRNYWFASEWRWYELAGLVAPLAILGWFSRTGSTHELRAVTSLSRTVLFLGVTGLTVSLLFAHPSDSTYLIARLQPLRAFHLVYLVMVLLLGAELGSRLLRQSVPRWTCALVLLSGLMYLPARAAYEHSEHIELEISNSSNKWVEAFLWIRNNTRLDALFALDSDYNNVPGEDTEIFRAIAERSAVPDRSKDGGVAAMARQLAPDWLAGETAQTGLDRLSHLTPEHADQVREAALETTGADWVVLTTGSPTALTCPYRNEVVKVCRLAVTIAAQSQTPALRRGSSRPIKRN